MIYGVHIGDFNNIVGFIVPTKKEKKKIKALIFGYRSPRIFCLKRRDNKRVVRREPLCTSRTASSSRSAKESLL
jgi:hypothetical protein